ncbi:hypothetical protein H5410_056889 [Solanum commersonii]|uniref:Uncharacterized protein n=1 Tax=Solanum commersonii TaxID=4109 RepID=A0A9J5WLG8_SOLCO|nr:hypothetical protein H5410_056889 [Solanum commersonii]
MVLTNTWIINSGSSEHMCFNSKFFISLNPLVVPICITLPNSFQIVVTQHEVFPFYLNLLKKMCFMYQISSIIYYVSINYTINLVVIFYSFLVVVCYKNL